MNLLNSKLYCVCDTGVVKDLVRKEAETWWPL